MILTGIRSTLRSGLVVLGFVCVLSVFFSGTALAARPGVITGSIKTKPTASTFEFPNIVFAVQAVPPYERTSVVVPLDGKYSLPVAAGPYVVFTNAWRGDALGYKTSSELVLVKAGKTVKLRSAVTRSIPHASPAKAPQGPDGPVISVGNIVLLDSNGRPFKKFDGSNITFDDIQDFELSRSPRSCRYYVAEDREFGHFNEMLKVLKKRAKTDPNPKTRKQLKTSLAQLPLWAPKYRLTGTISSGTPFFEANLKIIDLATGKSVWCKQLSFAGSLLFENFPQTIAKAVADTLCGKTDLPKSIQGDFSGQTIADPSEHWTGTTKYVPTETNPLAGRPTFEGVGKFTNYIPESVNISDWTISGGSACIVSGHTSGAITDFSSSVMFVEITGAECGERRYAFASTYVGPDTTPLTFNCGGGNIIVEPGSWGASLFSEFEIPTRSKFSNNKATGSFQGDNTNWSWDMTVTPP